MRINRNVCRSFALLVLASAGTGTFTPVEKSLSARGSSRVHAPIRVLGQREDGTVGTLNWSGYAVPGANVTDAKGSWIVPSVDCGDNATNYASFWAGIDGYSSSTVEQTGTDSDCSAGQPSYYAWFEFYPGPSFNVLDFPVSPGDNIEAEVSYNQTTQLFTAHIKNITTAQSFRISSAVPNAMRSSAEWIAEAPSSTFTGQILPLSKFGTVFMGHYYTGIAQTNWATVGGASGDIGTFPNVSDIVMVKNDGTIKALPSPLSTNGSSFAVTRE